MVSLVPVDMTGAGVFYLPQTVIKDTQLQNVLLQAFCKNTQGVNMQ